MINENEIRLSDHIDSILLYTLFCILLGLINVTEWATVAPHFPAKSAMVQRTISLRVWLRGNKSHCLKLKGGLKFINVSVEISLSKLLFFDETP